MHAKLFLLKGELYKAVSERLAGPMSMNFGLLILEGTNYLINKQIGAGKMVRHALLHN